VSALFFVQSNRARNLMTAFFDKLRQDRSLEEALRLIGGGSRPPYEEPTQDGPRASLGRRCSQRRDSASCHGRRG
jgi:hypothetical protein